MMRRNRYIVECKELPNLTFHITKRSRNRYIVECKVLLGKAIRQGRKSRNRYIVECKGGRKLELQCRKNVEIDTLWNVKNSRPKTPVYGD